MAFKYTLEEMIVVETAPQDLDERTVSKDYWGGFYVGFPHNRRTTIALVRGKGRALEKIEQQIDADPNVKSRQRVWAVLISKLDEKLSHEEREAMHLTSLHCWWDCNKYLGYVYRSPDEAKAALREVGTLGTVVNAEDVEVDFGAALAAMDRDLRDELHATMDPSSKQEFFDAYCEAHRRKYGEEFIYNRQTVPAAR